MNETSVIQVEVYAEDADEAFGVIEGALAGAEISSRAGRSNQESQRSRCSSCGIQAGESRT